MNIEVESHETGSRTIDRAEQSSGEKNIVCYYVLILEKKCVTDIMNCKPLKLLRLNVAVKLISLCIYKFSSYSSHL